MRYGRATNYRVFRLSAIQKVLFERYQEFEMLTTTIAYRSMAYVLSLLRISVFGITGYS